MKKEKIRKIYQKNGVLVDDDYIENAMKDKRRVEGFMRLYKQEELESMNYILGKSDTNKIFTQFELEELSKINLFDRNMINICKQIWTLKDNRAELEKYLKIINREVNI